MTNDVTKLYHINTNMCLGKVWIISLIIIMDLRRHRGASLHEPATSEAAQQRRHQ